MIKSFQKVNSLIVHSLNYLLLGKMIHSKFDNRKSKALLTGSLALVSSLVFLAYLIFDYSLGITSSYICFIITSILSFISLLLNRSGRYLNEAKMLLLISCNIGVFWASESENYDVGSSLFFNVIIVGTIALFGYEENRKAIFFSIIPIALFFISYFYDFSFIQKANYTLDDIQLHYTVNFIVTIFIIVTILVFFLNLNARSELELKKASNEVILNRRRFELAIQGSSVGIWDWDVNDDKLVITPLLMDTLGYPKGYYVNLSSNDFINILHREDKIMVLKAVESHLHDKKKFFVECRVKKYDQKYIWVLVSGQAYWDRNDVPKRMLGTVVDINDLKIALDKTEKQNELLEKTNAELDRFVYSSSHDLKAPLSSIQGLVTIAENSDSEEEVNQCLEIIKQRAISLNGFISEIIEYSRNTFTEVIKEKISIKSIVNEIVEGIKFFPKADLIDFDVQLPNDRNIISDRGRIKIILNNLIANAVKYHNFDSRIQPYVRIGVEEKEKEMIIYVADNGSGITKEFQKKIFEMFYRASNLSDGSGLGLYIAKEMALKLNGKLSVKSIYGKGSTFYFHLPK